MMDEHIIERLEKLALDDELTARQFNVTQDAMQEIKDLRATVARLREALEGLANDADELPEDTDIIAGGGFYTIVESSLLVDLHHSVKLARTTLAEREKEREK